MQVRIQLYINGQWTAPEGLATGYYVKPTIFGRVKPDPKA